MEPVGSARIDKELCRLYTSKQTYLQPDLSLTVREPITDRKTFLRVIKHHFGQHHMDKQDFVRQPQTHDSEVDVLEQPNREEEVVDIDAQSSASESSRASTPVSDKGRQEIEIEALQEQNRELLKQFEELKEQLKQPPPAKKARCSAKARKGKATSVPPPPSALSLEEKPSTERTLTALILHLMTIVTVRMDQYGEAYQLWTTWQDSKTPQVVMDVLGHILTIWAEGMASQDGTACCLGYLTQSSNLGSYTRFLSTQTWATCLRFFRSFGTPGVSAPRPTEASSSSVGIGTERHVPITMSYTTAAGSTTPASVEGCQVAVPYRRAVRPDVESGLHTTTFRDLQSISVLEDGRLYTSRSTEQNGSLIIKLELYRRQDVEHVERMDWWRHAMFRGTLMTSQAALMSEAYGLANHMETVMAARPDVTHQRGRSSTASKRPWRP